MEEEIIKITLDEVLSQIRKTQVDSVEGLCFWCSNNVKYYLEAQEIKCEMKNIKDLTHINYDHYFLIADDKYLIDLTYSQFVDNGEEVRFLEDFPANILEQTEEGQKILYNLLNDHYTEIIDSELETYLASFKSKTKREVIK